MKNLERRIWSSRRTLPLPKPTSNSGANIHLDALKNYMKIVNYDPFQCCPLMAINSGGNTEYSKCLRAPREILDPKILDQMHLPSGRNGTTMQGTRRSDPQKEFSSQWMLISKEESRMKHLQDCEDMVWELAKQNYDYKEKSKAL
ncbi:unnamed protein product [Strongylus vulgaris]|uniref:Uncharacterized protein n=1 Tax=Strongylus vulgaris TaxID=40348 RepID=A0A3P7JHI2_STRVU|nr:unnamed protein product [Strongylus vulgaris]